MKALYRKHLRLHRWLLLDLLVIALYYLCRGNRAWMNALWRNVTGPLQAFLGRQCARTVVSVMEMLALWLVLLSVWYVAWSVRAVVRSAHPWDRTYAALLGALDAALTLAALFCVLWGVNFWTDSFQDKSGLYALPVAKDDLYAVTEYFAEELSKAADRVDRDELGRFDVPRAEILAKAPRVYDRIERQYPFLRFDDVGVKGMFFSRLMTYLDFTGFYCSYTGEANVNMDSPACLLPSTAAHEMAHQRGFASEQECNFLAVLSCVTSGDPVYEYSGYLMGYIYLGNALWEEDWQAYLDLRAGLPDSVRADLAENNAYWEQYRNTAVRTVSNTVYDGILRSYGEERGMRSYGAMVDLLVAYYGALVRKGR